MTDSTARQWKRLKASDIDVLAQIPLLNEHYFLVHSAERFTRADSSNCASDADRVTLTELINHIARRQRNDRGGKHRRNAVPTIQEMLDMRF